MRKTLIIILSTLLVAILLVLGACSTVGEDAVAELRSQINTLEEELAANEATINTLQQEIQDTQNRLEELEKLLQDAGLLPQYYTLSFTLEADSNYSFPIYLQNEQTLHFTWWTEQGIEIWFGFTTPSGKFIGFYENGSFANSSLEEDFRSLLEGGVTVFSPSQYGWGEGYYEMVASAFSQQAEVQVQYWIGD
jgi:hypothetical protein